MRLGLVTHVYPALRGTGSIPGIFIPPFAQAVSERGHRVWVVAPDQQQSLQEEDGILVSRFAVSVPPGGLGALRASSPSDWWRLAQFLRRGNRALRHMLITEGADGLLAYWAFPSGLLCRWVQRSYAVPYAIWALGSDIYQAARVPGLRQAIVWSLRGASVRYANGPALCRTIEGMTGLLCKFLPAARPLPPPEPPDADGAAVHLLFAGRLEPVKGPDILLEAASLLANDGLNFHLWMVGEGSLRDTLQTTIAQHGLGDRVSLLGYVSDGRLAGYLSAADMLVVSSRSESMPLAVTEAARFGTPVVVTDVGDMGPLVRRHQAGLAVPPQRPDLLTSAILEIAQSQTAHAFADGLQTLSAAYSMESSVDCFLEDAEGWHG